ncbi:MAG: peptidylprolyl isomerase [Clostridia bacterium]|nr:peptidylprolyl isomerase [Clostridia bacterium]MBR5284140.1 peptidylprolyl isomerase [Clostridia bacterium]
MAKKNVIKAVLKLRGMTDEQAIRIELYPDIAPITVENFVKLIDSGFYKDVKFHRCIRDFMVQGGDPTGTGSGGPGWRIKGEFASNGVKNDLKHTRGVVSMARTMDPNSAGSQFFIMVADAPHLDGEYAAFGKVTEGMEFVDKIVDDFEQGTETYIKTIKVKK